jgi:hypothetical protein
MQIVKKQIRFYRRYFLNLKALLYCISSTHFHFTKVSFFIHTRIGLGTFLNFIAQFVKPLLIIFLSKHK